MFSKKDGKKSRHFSMENTEGGNGNSLQTYIRLWRKGINFCLAGKVRCNELHLQQEQKSWKGSFLLRK